MVYQRRQNSRNDYADMDEGRDRRFRRNELARNSRSRDDTHLYAKEESKIARKAARTQKDRDIHLFLTMEKKAARHKVISDVI